MPKLGNVTRYDDRRVICSGNIINNFANNELPVVLVHKQALHDMYRHATSESQHEIGGYLLGYPALDETTGIEATYVEKAIRAIYDSSPSHITLHPVSFNEVEDVRQRDGTIIVGWYHSHPRMGIFFSATDRKNHEDYHPENYQIAIVIDPGKTPERAIESRSEWIGFFGWDKGKEIVRLPIENVYYLDTCPGVVSIAPPISTQQMEIKATIAETLEHLSRSLRESRGVFDTELPIVIFPREIQEELLRTTSGFPREGFLFGEVDQVAGYSLITVDSAYPYELDKVQEYLGLIREMWRQHSKYPDKQYPELKPYLEGFSLVGIYFAQERLAHFSCRSWLRHSHLNFRTFAKYCGDDYIVVMVSKSEHGKKIPTLTMWSSSDRKLLEIPVSQVVTKGSAKTK